MKTPKTGSERTTKSRKNSLANGGVFVNQVLKPPYSDMLRELVASGVANTQAEIVRLAISELHKLKVSNS